VIVCAVPPECRNSTQHHNVIDAHPCKCVVLDYNAATLYHNMDILAMLTDVYSEYSNDHLPVLIINTIGESPTLEHFSFVPEIKKIHPTLKIVHLTTGWEPPQLFYTTITDSSSFLWPAKILWDKDFSYAATHHYIALARSPKAHRTRFINNLLNLKLEKYGYFSIGSGEEWSTLAGSTFYDRHQKILGIDKHNLKYFPTLIDGAVAQDFNIDIKSYSVSDTRIKNALLNVVLETSYEIRFNNWTVPMLTEKTTKAFALGQIPLILGPKAQVEHTRDMGFDMFDDFVDHSYDNEQDPEVRITKFANSLKQFIIDVPANKLQTLKDTLLPRFLQNKHLAEKLTQDNTDVNNRITMLLDNLHDHFVINYR